ncbi:MAG: esterase-like activity of phytase family protein [Pseudomonadota bacterium]|nr:esterase-like activity of phytase family protein [Pseudomonadota bacterium]
MKVAVRELEWSEHSLGEVPLPKELLKLSAGIGSGLVAVPGTAGASVWAISDRGPNIKLKDAQERYGWNSPAEWREADGVKLMPRPDVGPMLALLEVGEKSVRLDRMIRLTDQQHQPISGLPIPDSGHAECEPALDLEGRHLQPDPNGMDTEGIALLDDGSFWVGEEYGPSLVRIAADGRVRTRLVPQGTELAGAGYPVSASLPSIAAKRHLNRGFEAVAASPDGAFLFLAFQSPLAHPGEQEHKGARHVRLWQMSSSGEFIAQFLYRLDEPATFKRDNREGKVDRSDLKVCEMVALDGGQLLLLERASETCKLYRVRIDPALALGAEHVELETRPTVEQLSCQDAALPELSKELLFSSDDWPDVGSDIEGVALLDDRTLLIVGDNDFGCEGKQTRFYRLTFEEALAGA